MANLATFLQTGGAAPEIETPKFLTDYTGTDDTYYWDVMFKRAMPEGLVLSNVVSVNRFDSAPIIGSQLNQPCGGVTTDGKTFYLAFYTSATASTTSYKLGLYVRDNLNDAHARLDQTEPVTIASTAGVNSRIKPPVKAGDNIWFVVVGNTTVGSADPADVIKIEYDTGTEAFTITESANDFGSGMSVTSNTWTLHMLYDPNNSVVLIFAPQGGSTGCYYEAFDVATATKSDSGLVPDSEFSAGPSYSGRGYNRFFLTSDGNFANTTTDGTAKGGVYSYDGAAFSQVFDSTLTVEIVCEIAEDVYISKITGFETVGGNRLSYSIVTYDSGTQELTATAYFQYVAGDAGIFSAANPIVSLGDNWLMTVGGTASVKAEVAVFRVDPDNNYQIVPGSIVASASAMQGSRSWINEDGIGFSGSFGIANGAGDSQMNAFAHFSTGNLVPKRRAIPMGSLVSTAAGTDTIRLDFPNVQSGGGLTAGDIYGGVVAVATENALYLENNAPAWMMVFVDSILDSLTQNTERLDAVNNLGSVRLAGTREDSTTQTVDFTAEYGGTVGLFAYPYSESAAGNVTFCVFADGFCTAAHKVNVQNTTTTRYVSYVSGAKKAGAAAGAELADCNVSVQPKWR